METIVIVDYGSQYTQLIAKALRSFNQYCEIIPPSEVSSKLKSNEKLKGIILSGSKDSVLTGKGFTFTDYLSIPILGICYGFQLMADYNRLRIVEESGSEFGKTLVSKVNNVVHPLLVDLPETSFNVWMSHSHSVVSKELELESTAKVLMKNESGDPVALHFNCTNQYGLLFHPEVTHTQHGIKVLHNFVTKICGCKLLMTANNYIDERIKYLKSVLGEGDDGEHVIMAVSGGVDSTVAAKMLYHAINNRLHCVCIDTGLLRLNEYQRIRRDLNNSDLPVTYIDSSSQFLKALKGITDPEQKRVKIGKTFVDVFSQIIVELPFGGKKISYLGQGTIYPDMIESGKTGGAKIKSHHNVGGLPRKLGFKVVEPIWDLFKDEVRIIGKELGVIENILNQHPFPGPGLAIRVMGEVTSDKLRILQSADAIFLEELRKSEAPGDSSKSCYEKIWQAGVILLSNTKTVGVMGDVRTYNHPVALRAVVSVDGMTADIYPIPYNVLSKVSGRIINEVKGINRVVYDISSKPPATIEWE